MKNNIDDNEQTSRSVEREKEDSRFTPVIIKRTDEVNRHPDDTLEKAIEEGIEQYDKSNIALFISSIAAGLILGFAAMSVALVTQLFDSESSVILERLGVAFVYPLGFIVCIFSGVQLFTEHTATAVYPVLERKVKIKELLTLLLIVLVGNFVGTFLSSTLLYVSDSVILASEGFLKLTEHLLHYSAGEVFVSAVLAGWLMAQGGWLIMATPPTSIQLICIYIVTFLIGLGGFHHSIVGSAEIFSGLLHSDQPEILKSIKFLFFAVLGNLLGGSFFVGILNYTFIKKSK